MKDIYENLDKDNVGKTHLILDNVEKINSLLDRCDRKLDTFEQKRSALSHDAAGLHRIDNQILLNKRMKLSLEKALFGHRKELDMLNQIEKSVVDFDSVLTRVDSSTPDDNSVDNTELVILVSDRNNGDEDSVVNTTSVLVYDEGSLPSSAAAVIVSQKMFD